MDFPSSQFYGGKLASRAEKTIVTKLLDWEGLSNHKFAVQFRQVAGEDIRDADSPSWYNPAEISEVCRLVGKLLRSPKSGGLVESSIAVISPFWKHNVKTREQLRHKGHGGVRVGSVEEFQGKEFMVVIISTVRASRLWEKRYDRPFSLGFMNDERMMNTAFTRAMALLIVVGDPFVLTEDKHWNLFLKWTKANDAYVGDHADSAPVVQARLAREAKLEAKLQKEGLSAALQAAAEDPLMLANEADDEEVSGSDDLSNAHGGIEQDFDYEFGEEEEEDWAAQQSNGVEAVPVPVAPQPEPPSLTPNVRALLQEYSQVSQKYQQYQTQKKSVAPVSNGHTTSSPATPALLPAGLQFAWGPQKFPMVSTVEHFPALPFLVVDRGVTMDIEISIFNSLPSVSRNGGSCALVSSVI